MFQQVLFSSKYPKQFKNGGKLENHHLCRGQLTQTGTNERPPCRNQRAFLFYHVLQQETGNRKLLSHDKLIYNGISGILLVF